MRADRNLAYLLQYEHVAWYEQGCVRILDRRIYPRKVEYVSCRSHKEVAQAIADMVTQSGGPFLAAAMGMALAAHECRGMGEKEALDYLKKAAWTLSHARPTTSARMQSITEECLKEAEKALAAGKQADLAVFEHSLARMEAKYRRIGRTADYLSDLFPEKGGILFLGILLWILIKRRYRVFLVAAMALMILFGISFLLYTGWFLSWTESLPARNFAGYGLLFSKLLQTWLPRYGVEIGENLRWFLLLLLLWIWFRIRKKGFQHFLWASAFSCLLMPFFNFRVSPYFSAIFLFPLPLLFRGLLSRWGKRTAWLVSLFLMIVLAAWLVVMKIEDGAQWLLLIYPMLLAIGLYWVRWWHLELPHTWSDEIKKFQNK